MSTKQDWIAEIVKNKVWGEGYTNLKTISEISAEIRKELEKRLPKEDNCDYRDTQFRQGFVGGWNCCRAEVVKIIRGEK